MEKSCTTKFTQRPLIKLSPVKSRRIIENNQNKSGTNHLEVYMPKCPQTIALQENNIQPMNAFKEGLKERMKQAFKIKIPYFPKRPFGKHDSLNNSELNFVEINIKDNTHNLFEQHSKFYKIVCGRASSVGRRREKVKSWLNY